MNSSTIARRVYMRDGLSFHSLLGVAALVVLAFMTGGCGTKEAAGPPPARPPTTVTAGVVSSRDVPIYLDEIGKCVAPEVVSIQPQVSGRITEIFVKDGAELKKGDPLFTIDPRPFEIMVEQSKADIALNKASLEQAEASLNEYQAALDEAKANLAQNNSRQQLNQMEFERARNLFETHAVSKQEFDSKQMTVAMGESQIKASAAAVAHAEAQLKQGSAVIAMAKAKMEASDAAIRMAQLNLDYTKIVSPIDGRAGQRLADLGNIVTSNSSVLLVIQRLNPIYVDFTVPEAELGRVKDSMKAGELKINCCLPGGKCLAGGDVVFIDSAIQEGTGTLKLRAIVPNAERAFWPGQFLNVQLLLGTKKNATLVPAVASQVGQVGTFVYVMKPDSTVELRPIKAGQRQGDELVVDEGVAAGEHIVLTGQMMLYPGAKVQIKPDTTPEMPAKNSKAEAMK